MFSGHGALGLIDVCQWKKLVDAAHRVAIDNFGEHVCDIRLRVDPIEFAAFDERSKDCPVLAAANGASEEMVLSARSDGSHGALDNV